MPTLGRTALHVSRVGLGLAALGRPGYINVGHATDLGGQIDERAMEANAHATLDAAFDGGVRYFDAARSYGLAEAFLGSWMAARGYGPGDLTVGSKWGYTYTADWRIEAEVHEVKELTLATLRRQIEESRALLGSHLRLYQIHSVTLDSGVLEDRAVLDELARLRSEGLAIGFTVTGPSQRETIERAVQVGGFDTVQATWNLLDPSCGAALEVAGHSGLGVIVKEAVANGRLTARGQLPELDAVAAELGVGADAVALAAALAQPWADVVLSGASAATMMRSNLAAEAVELGEEHLTRLRRLAEPPDRYWETRSALPWN